MPTDEERLAQLREEETKAKLFSWLDEWLEGKKNANGSGPARTKSDSKASFFESLFS